MLFSKIFARIYPTLEDSRMYQFLLYAGYMYRYIFCGSLLVEVFVFCLFAYCFLPKLSLQVIQVICWLAGAAGRRGLVRDPVGARYLVRDPVGARGLVRGPFNTSALIRCAAFSSASASASHLLVLVLCFTRVFV